MYSITANVNVSLIQQGDVVSLAVAIRIMQGQFGSEWKSDDHISCTASQQDLAWFFHTGDTYSMIDPIMKCGSDLVGEHILCFGTKSVLMESIWMISYCLTGHIGGEWIMLAVSAGVWAHFSFRLWFVYLPSGCRWYLNLFIVWAQKVYWWIDAPIFTLGCCWQCFFL